VKDDLDTYESNGFVRDKPDRLSFNVYENMDDWKSSGSKSHRRSKSYGGTVDKQVHNLKTSESNGVAEMAAISKLIRILLPLVRSSK